MLVKKIICCLLLIGVFAENEERKEEAPPPLSQQMRPQDLPTIRFDADPNCHPGDVDLIFVVDGSGSIGDQNFLTVKNFLKNIVTELNIGSTHSQVGVVQFWSRSETEFYLNSYSTSDAIKTAIDNIVYAGGGTYIAGGMDRALNDGFTSQHGDRDDVTNVMVVLTDGQDGRIRDVQEAYLRASQQGDIVFAVGVGHGVSMKELYAITGNNKNRTFDVSTFNDLSKITGQICEDIQDTDPCKEDPCNGHGQCHKVTGGGPTDFNCTCDPGYHGGNCEISVCEHGGTFHCDCPFGYTGPTCGDVIDFCNSTNILQDGSILQIPFCGPHGHCENTPEGAVCICLPDWTGIFCDENINDCDPVNPCLNGGTCIDNPSEPGYTCECDRLHQGVNCSENVDFCKDLDIIVNGTEIQVHVCGEHGICQNTPGGALCICQDDEFATYTGKFCEEEHPKSCVWKGHTYPHNSTWVDKCDSCSCLFGQVECADTKWCPQRCALYNTTRVWQDKIPIWHCPPNHNCIPENVTCAKPVCDYPVGWCFPVGMVIVDDIKFPTNPPNGYKRGKRDIYN